MELTIEELLLIRNSLMETIRVNNNLVDITANLLAHDKNMYKDSVKPFLDEIEKCGDLITRINKTLAEKGSVL